MRKSEKKKLFDGVMFKYLGNSKSKKGALDGKDEFEKSGWTYKIDRVKGKSLKKPGFSYDVYVYKKPQ